MERTVLSHDCIQQMVSQIIVTLHLLLNQACSVHLSKLNTVLRDHLLLMSPFGHRAVDCISLDEATQSIPCPLSSSSIEPTYIQLNAKNVAWDPVTGLTEVKIGDVRCSR